MALILSIDQGTTGTRSMLFNSNGEEIANAYEEHNQFFPSPGWVEHDPSEIWLKSLQTTKSVIKSAKIAPSDIAGIGITNQRETIVAWNKDTGTPLHNAIVWQCRRTAQICDQLKEAGYEEIFKKSKM